MLVVPLVGYDDVPYRLIALSTSERSVLKPSTTSASVLKNTTPAPECPLEMSSWSSTVKANVRTPLTCADIELLRSRTSARAMRCVHIGGGELGGAGGVGGGGDGGGGGEGA